MYSTVVQPLPGIDREREKAIYEDVKPTNLERFINLRWFSLTDESDSVFGLISTLSHNQDTLNKVSVNSAVNLLGFDIKVELFLCLNSHINSG